MDYMSQLNQIETSLNLLLTTAEADRANLVVTDVQEIVDKISYVEGLCNILRNVLTPNV